MEHIKVKELSNGYFRLTPEEGYRIRNKAILNTTYSEVVTKTPDVFEAVYVGVDE